MKWDASELGSRIRMYRSYLDMTQAELADAVGVNLTTIVKYEDGAMVPGADKLLRIAEVLRRTPNDLLCGAGTR